MRFGKRLTVNQSALSADSYRRSVLCFEGDQSFYVVRILGTVSFIRFVALTGL